MGLGQPIEIAFYENRTQHCSHTSGISKSIRPSPGHVRRNRRTRESRGTAAPRPPGAAGPARSAHHEQIRHRYAISTFYNNRERSRRRLSRSYVTVCVSRLARLRLRSVRRSQTYVTCSMTC